MADIRHIEMEDIVAEIEEPSRVIEHLQFPTDADHAYVVRLQGGAERLRFDPYMILDVGVRFTLCSIEHALTPVALMLLHPRSGVQLVGTIPAGMAPSAAHWVRRVNNVLGDERMITDIRSDHKAAVFVMEPDALSGQSWELRLWKSRDGHAVLTWPSGRQERFGAPKLTAITLPCEGISIPPKALYLTAGSAGVEGVSRAPFHIGTTLGGCARVFTAAVFLGNEF